MTDEYVIDDSGERKQFESGMQRDTAEGKMNHLLVRDGPMYKRWVQHMTAGAQKYDERNWMKASGVEEYERFITSASRHFEEWLEARTIELHGWLLDGYFTPSNTREDVASGTLFNIDAAEWMRDQQLEYYVPEEQPAPTFAEAVRIAKAKIAGREDEAMELPAWLNERYDKTLSEAVAQASMDLAKRVDASIWDGADEYIDRSIFAIGDDCGDPECPCGPDQVKRVVHIEDVEPNILDGDG